MFASLPEENPSNNAGYTMDPSMRRRVILNEKLARDIYMHKLQIMEPNSFMDCFQATKMKMRGESAKIAKRYSVSAKAIRDIWNRKSWNCATSHLRRQEREAVFDGKVMSFSKFCLFFLLPGLLIDPFMGDPISSRFLTSAIPRCRIQMV
jgi:hypothetical protein